MSAPSFSIDETFVAKGFDELNKLSLEEYHQTLEEVLADGGEVAAERVGRLIGVLIKQPFAVKVDRSSATFKSRAYREWNLVLENEFRSLSYEDLWQYRLLNDYLRPAALQDDPKATDAYKTALYAQQESGFFGLLLKNVGGYICGDPEIRKIVDEAFKRLGKGTGISKAPTPESVVASGGLALGVYLVRIVPALGTVGAPVIAGLVTVIYVLGVQTFCEWRNSGLKGLRSNGFEED
jgi:hypothetical protein